MSTNSTPMTPEDYKHLLRDFRKLNAAHEAIGDALDEVSPGWKGEYTDAILTMADRIATLESELAELARENGKLQRATQNPALYQCIHESLNHDARVALAEAKAEQFKAELAEARKDADTFEAHLKSCRERCALMKTMEGLSIDECAARYIDAEKRAKKLGAQLAEARKEEENASWETTRLRVGVTKAIGLKWDTVCPADKDIIAACERLAALAAQRGDLLKAVSVAVENVALDLCDNYRPLTVLTSQLHVLCVERITKALESTDVEQWLAGVIAKAKAEELERIASEDSHYYSDALGPIMAVEIDDLRHRAETIRAGIKE